VSALSANKQLERTVIRRAGHVVTRPLNCGVRRHRKARLLL
jgi:hypothetical protein